MSALQLHELPYNNDQFSAALHALNSTRSFYVDMNKSKSDAMRINTVLQEICRSAGCNITTNGHFQASKDRPNSGWTVEPTCITHEDGLHIYTEDLGTDRVRIHVEDVSITTSYFRKPLVAISRCISQGFSPVAKHSSSTVDAVISRRGDGSLISDRELTLSELFICLNQKYQFSWEKISQLFGIKHEQTTYAIAHEELTVEDVLTMKRDRSYYGNLLPTLFIGQSSTFDVNVRKFIRK